MTPKIGPQLLKQLTKRYEPNHLVRFKFGRYDVATKTDDDGYPRLLYLGTANEEGTIKGDHFSRRLVKDEHGAVVKDHWDYKGKV